MVVNKVEQEDIVVTILSLTARVDDIDIGKKVKEVNKICNFWRLSNVGNELARN